MKIPINEIMIGERRRKDLGDIQELADSINMWGLLHPIVVTQGEDGRYRLVAGERRIKACQMLGYQNIEVKLLENLTAQELREIELEENIRRKNLNDNELLELAKIKEQKLESDFLRTRNNSRGRPPKNVVPEKAVAEAVGVPLNTLRDAKARQEAVEKYPELEPLPKIQAIQTAKQLDTLPPEERPAVIEALKPVPPEQEPIQAKTPEEEEREKQLKRAHNFKVGIDRLLSRLHLFSTHEPETYFQGMDEIDWAFERIGVFAENQLSIIDAAISWLTKFRAEYAARMVRHQGQLRRVK